MPKKTTKEKHDKKKHKFRDDKYHSKHSKKHNSETSLIDIGKTNVKRWKLLKFKCSCQTDTDFVVYLLNLLEENFWKICQNNKLDLDNGPKSPEKCEPNTDETPPKKQTIIKFHHTPENDTKITSHQSTERSSHKKKYVPEPTLPISILIEKALQEPSTAPKVCPLEEIPRSMFPEILTNDTLTNNQTPTDTPIRNFDLNTSIPASEKLLPLPVPIIKSPIWNSCKPEAKIPVSGIVKPVEASSDVDTCDPCEKQDSSLSGNNSESNVGEELEDASGVSRKKIKRKEHDAKHARKKLKHHDIRKAPQLEFTVQPHTAQNGAGETNSVDTDGEGVRVKIKLCYSCDTRHLQDACPLQRPVAIISDQLSLSEWKTKKPIKVEEVTLDGGESEERMLTYAEASVPEDCYLQEVEEGHGLSVFAKVDIAKYAQFGPLVGPRIKEVDIPDDFNMKHIWELRAGEHQSYINTEDAGLSNWVRFIRPAQSRDKRNVTAITRNKTLYLISNERIEAGDEIRYWTDDVTNSGKRRMEKTNCGGCNLSFAHALYYRTHCSVFHDARYSLTIRKYHCKVCGQAVLGKDNIVRHAAELHNGQGAYQCQFCKKFFLRLNYLEMHRTYGCAANPHRSRPLCDFCGRKFCQPQKLKVHIKRMHSDISLSEFQCPLCLKLLGSRAAVQRHAREVHRGSAISGAISPAPTGNTTLSTSALSCSRCGKLFQNKSNLKIHMLTHSGVKPFKCKEDNCNAAFTTKQCLQFHYKKVHGFAEDVMPTIERSVEYTFAAYSGGAARDEDIIVATPNSAPSPKLIEDISIGETVKETSPEQNATVDINIRGDSPPIALECEKQPYLSGPPLLSKGSKKWLGDVSNHAPNNDLYSFEDDPQQNTDDASSIILDVDESQPENNTDNKFSMCLNVYNPRHDSSNASLLVEAALDSVSDIQINTESNQNCSDSLVVSNLYPLSHQDGYLQNDLTTERGDVSVTDYDGLQHDEFSAPSSPTLPSHLIHEYVVRHDEPRQRNEYHLVDRSPTATHSPPRYDFNQSLNTENISNDSDGIVAQNLTVHAKDKDRLDHQLDFSSYKTHYNDVDSSDLSLRKYDSIRSKFDIQTDDRDNYNITIDVTDGRKSYDGVNGDLRKQFISDGGLNNDQYSDVMDTSDLKNVTSDIEMRNKTYDSLDSDALRALKYDLESKYEIEIRNKGYDILEADDLRNKVIYDATIENDLRQNKSYNLVEADFRSDRSFEPLILNPTELQGLDMSARGYHGFHSSSAVSRYHHMYGEPDRETGVGGYGPPTDVLRVVSLDLTSQGRHGGLHSLHSHHGLLTDHSRLTLDQTRLISSEHNLSVALLGSEGRLLSDHTTNRILSTDGLSDARLVPSPDTHRMLSETARLPGRGFSSYPMSPAAYHPPPLSARSHIGSPSHNPPSYHHYSGYY